MRGLNIIADSEDFLKLLRTVQTMTPYVYADSGTPLDALSPEEILAYEHFRAFAQEPEEQVGGIRIQNSTISSAEISPSIAASISNVFSTPKSALPNLFLRPNPANTSLSFFIILKTSLV